MADLNLALYYPSMEFQDTDWLKGMLLFWDGIRRIVPESYTPWDNDEVKAFVEAGLVKSIDPSKDAANIANEFRDKLDNLYHAAALDWIKRPQEYERHYRIHPDKIDARLRDILTSREISLATKDWMTVSEEFGRFYMFYLANAIADRTRLAKITDAEEAWTASSYFAYDGSIKENPVFTSDKQIVTLMLKDFIPRNIEEISTDSITSFREKYRDERKRFIDSINGFVTRISAISDQQIVDDAIREYKKDVEIAVKDFRHSLRSLKITSLTGIKTISFPAGFGATTWGTGHPEYLTISTAAGLVLGLLTSYADYQGKRKKLVKESDFSYLYFLSGSFKKFRGDGSLIYHLYRDMHEFIDD